MAESKIDIAVAIISCMFRGLNPELSKSIYDKVKKEAILKGKLLLSTNAANIAIVDFSLWSDLCLDDGAAHKAKVILSGA